MINLTKQEIEYFNPIINIKAYQEFLMLLQDAVARYLSMFNITRFNNK